MKNILKPSNKNQQDPDDKVKIIIRLRPILNDEDSSPFVELEDNHTLKILKPGNHSHMRFSNILSSDSNQQDVFQLAKDSIQSFLKGINNTIFAYGQTGAGKTYSIIGDYSHLQSRDNLETYLTGNQRGILSRSLQMIMQELKKKKEKQSRILLSFFEVYNQKIYDLYNNSTIPLQIRQSKNGDISIPDLLNVQVTNIHEAIEYLSIGLKNRVTGSTHANSKSSRSHSIFQITYQKLVKISGIQSIQVSSLRIVDLAGSEKFKIPSDLSATEKQIRIQELTSINGSLSCLGHCISALIQKSRTHIPFRNSKLTRILSDSLIGSGKMKFVVCISPSMSASAETFSTLQFANRAKKAILDRSPVPKQLAKKSSNSEQVLQLKLQLEKERQLRMELEKQLKVYKENNNFEEQNKILRKENQELKQKLNSLSLSRSSRIKEDHRISINTQQRFQQNEQNKGLLKLSVFRQNRQNMGQSIFTENAMEKSRKKLDFEKKLKKFIDNESPPIKTSNCKKNEYSFEKNQEVEQSPEKQNQLQEHQETFELYDQYQSFFKSDDNHQYDSNINFIQNTCKNMKVDSLFNLKEEMMRAKKQLQNLQQKDNYLQNLKEKIPNYYKQQRI